MKNAERVRTVIVPLDEPAAAPAPPAPAPVARTAATHETAGGIELFEDRDGSKTVVVKKVVPKVTKQQKEIERLAERFLQKKADQQQQREHAAKTKAVSWGKVVPPKDGAPLRLPEVDVKNPLWNPLKRIVANPGDPHSKRKLLHLRGPMAAKKRRYKK